MNSMLGGSVYTPILGGSIGNPMLVENIGVAKYLFLRHQQYASP
jgi:hypothetical protein